MRILPRSVDIERRGFPAGHTCGLEGHRLEILQSGRDRCHWQQLLLVRLIKLGRGIHVQELIIELVEGGVATASQFRDPQSQNGKRDIAIVTTFPQPILKIAATQSSRTVLFIEIINF